MLKDSLQIQALIGDPVLHDKENNRINISIFSKIGLSGRQFVALNDLNASLDTLGYGRIPEAGLGWTFGNQIDIGERLSLGYSYYSNIFLNDFVVGDNFSSRYGLLCREAIKLYKGGLNILFELRFCILRTSR